MQRIHHRLHVEVAGINAKRILGTDKMHTRIVNGFAEARGCYFKTKLTGGPAYIRTHAIGRVRKAFNRVFGGILDTRREAIQI